VKVLILLSGALATLFIFVLDRVLTLTKKYDSLQNRGFFKILFVMYVIMTVIYHAAYFLTVGFSTWFSLIPVASFSMFAIGMILMRTTAYDPKFAPLEHSATVNALTGWSAVITLFFLFVPHFFLHVA